MPDMEFAEFYEGNRDRCLSAIAFVVRDRLLAEDLAAEAFARAFARWPKLQTHPDPRAWVVRTALNANVSRWRRHRREVYLGDQIEVGVTDPVADDQLAAAVAALPLRQRQVIALRIFLDLGSAASADVLGISPATVSTHLQRALATLQAGLVPAAEMRNPS
jgi:RNA polymerase sigma factor (sigma-70 family)